MEELPEEWNMAKGYFEITYQLLYQLKDNYRFNQPISYHKNLGALHIHIYAKLNTNDKEKSEKINKEITEYINQANKKGTPVDMNILRRFHLFLMQKLEDKGLLTPKGDDPTKAYKSGRR